MKVFFIVLLSSTYLFACYCNTDIQNGYNNTRTQIEKVLNNATRNMQNELIPELEKNINDIKKQNEILQKIVKALKEETKQKDEILFLLKQNKGLLND